MKALEHTEICQESSAFQNNSVLKYLTYVPRAYAVLAIHWVPICTTSGLLHYQAGWFGRFGRLFAALLEYVLIVWPRGTHPRCFTMWVLSSMAARYLLPALSLDRRAPAQNQQPPSWGNDRPAKRFTIPLLPPNTFYVSCSILVDCRSHLHGLLPCCPREPRLNRHHPPAARLWMKKKKNSRRGAEHNFGMFNSGLLREGVWAYTLFLKGGQRSYNSQNTANGTTTT